MMWTGVTLQARRESGVLVVAGVGLVTKTAFRAIKGFTAAQLAMRPAGAAVIDLRASIQAMSYADWLDAEREEAAIGCRLELPIVYVVSPSQDMVFGAHCRRMARALMLRINGPSLEVAIEWAASKRTLLQPSFRPGPSPQVRRCT